MEDREMTLKEWCNELPESHLVNKQLAGLKNLLKTNKEPVAEVPCSDGVIKPCPFCGGGQSS